MDPASSNFSGYCVCFLLLQVMTSTSRKLMVTVPKEHLVARVGGQAALSCQLSPPRSAEHMEVRWFRGDNSRLVHLYRSGHEVNGEAAPEYVNRTEFVTEAMGEGKVTLRIRNVSISDDGPYWCSFKDTDFSDAASLNLGVAALGLETQIHVQVLINGGLQVECNSGGWFPQPQMEWRDSRGEVIPHSSKSSSQDGARLFHMKMTLLLRNLSDSNIICYVCNPETGEEKRTSIIIAGALFNKDYLRMNLLISLSCIIPLLLLMYIFLPCCRNTEYILGCRLQCLSRYLGLLYSMRAQLLFCIISSAILLAVYVPYRTRVFISDSFFSLYNCWMIDIIIVTAALAVYFTFVIWRLISNLQVGAMS